MNTNDYPTEQQLELCTDWLWEHAPVTDLIDHIESIWWMPDWGFKRRTEKGIIYLELHTGGWSGNEEIIYALRQNIYFWNRYWHKHIHGGHYYFEIKKDE